ncbi:MAG TPA: phage tail tape measure protein [Methanothrix sp.]|nr:phage tail tape measure protein [Methanothrix sp.]
MSDTDLAFRATLDGSGFASGAQRINGQLQQMGFHTQTATAGLGGVGTLLGTMANPATAAALAVTALGGALVGSAQSAAAWQTSMTGVAKTTGLDGAELAELSDQLLTMSTNMPVAASGLAEIAQAGGSLGIVKEELAGFTEVAAQMGVGFEMSAEQAATAGAKILNAFGQEMNTENLRSLGSVVNAMGDSFAATEPQVLDFLNRASFLNTTMGQSIPQVAALGTTLVSAGMEAEVAATGIKSAINMLTSETSKKGGMDNWAKLMGTDVDTLKGKIAEDLNGTLIETANVIAGMADPTERFQAAVAAAGTEGAPALLKLAGAGEDYAKALGMSNSEWENATSLQKTYDAQMSTVTSQWTIFTNTLSMASTSLGTGLLPYLADALGLMTDVAKIGMKVGEVIGSWNLGEKASAVFKNSPIGMLLTSDTVTDAVSGAWGDLKNWAGIGTEHAEQMAKEIEENDNLKKAAAEALDTPEAKAAMEKAGKTMGEDLAKTVSEEMIAGLQSGMSDLDVLAMINSQSSKANKEFDRMFEYAGKSLRMHLSEGGSGDFYSLFSGDKLLGGGQIYSSPIEAFEAITGLPAPEKGTAEYFRLMGQLVEAEKMEMKAALEAKKTPLELFTIVDRDAMIDTATDALQKSLTNAWSDGKLYDAEKAHLKQLAFEYEAAGGDMSDALVQAIKAGDWAAAGKYAGKEFAKNLVGGAKIEMPSLLEMVEDPKLIMETFESIPKFQENYLIPRLTENMDEVKELMTSGVKEQDIIDAYIKPLEAVYDYMPEKLQDIYKQVTNGQMSLESFVDQYYDGFTEKADEKASEAAEAFKSTNAMFYNEILDDSEHWSNYINSEGGFIGPTAKWYEMKIDEQAELNNIAALKQLYESMGGESPAMVGSIATKLDTTEAYNDLEAIKADIVSANPTAMLELDTSVADSRFQNFFKLVEESRPTMYFDAVPVVDMGALVSAIAAALRAEGV